MTNTRTESDSMGELEVPSDALYGAQTQRAINNFPVSGERMPLTFIRTLVTIKKAAAIANRKLDTLDADIADAIEQACDTLLSDPELQQHFPVDIFQTGSGTSTNMNANEVIANLANQRQGKREGGVVHPNDHVNNGQSSNDVIPTTIHASAAIEVSESLIPAITRLIDIIDTKANSVSDYCKTGRTHLMDAMPVRMDQSLRAWSAQLSQQLETVKMLQPAIQTLAQGGTAVGTGVNAHPDFAETFASKLSELTGIAFTPAENCFALISSQDTAVTLSGAIKSLAVTLMKVSNDLRWMNSGPLAGLGEVSLPALQPGSSIMPGKVNPVIPEAVAMASAQVIGNDAAITIGGQSGNFELNVMLPMIADNLLSSIKLMSNSCVLLGEQAIEGFTVNQENLEKALAKNPILVTALNPIIGYAKAAEIAKKAYKDKMPVIDVAEAMTDLPRSELESLLDPKKLTEIQR
ncbi:MULTISPECIES: class II fumarate hydratase [Alteromonas]|uniref:Fumarate hydratase class II n=1 Tax=Alteromonas stellipolaris TaxID=233316 RepID=A0AAW7Z6I3_9ALTE|nr:MULTISPECIES: class II fumarate hydratase [Alteromonas]AMJ91804.1 class II fumarate hydratase [Alteromonas sp. Mac2]ALM89341.1 Fumarate hydratase class II [Alteromonas stellipolaris LMG 21856]AMJ75515.1 class II fumarate hydratase [Alteromonas stellipolaris]AMJ87940.1 class II fumarate hydratase [Alteromonas sp. Mac1]ANB21347.1 aspartate ammonia-lyase [Alteromonas stellipolaris]